MKVLFAGTPEFAVHSLLALVESRHSVCAAMTQPDRRSGRGLAPAASPVKRFAVERGIRVLQPETLRDARVQEELRSLEADAIATAAFGLILPQAVLDMAPRGALNVHASLLPRWRGAAPIQRALLAGDEVTGVSIMLMDAGLDTGPVMLQEPLPISPADTAGTLTARLAERGGRLLVQVLDGLEAGALQPVPQVAGSATYASKPERREFRVDWSEGAARVNRRLRAFNPAPGAGARIRGVDLKLWSCDVVEGKGEPGEVLSADSRGLCVACGEDAVLVTQLQRPGGKRLHAAEFLRGFALSPGDRFEAQGTG